MSSSPDAVTRKVAASPGNKLRPVERRIPNNNDGSSDDARSTPPPCDGGSALSSSSAAAPAPADAASDTSPSCATNNITINATTLATGTTSCSLLLADPSASFSDGYITPNDYASTPDATGRKLITCSSPNEDVEGYMDYVMSDEEGIGDGFLETGLLDFDDDEEDDEVEASILSPALLQRPSPPPSPPRLSLNLNPLISSQPPPDVDEEGYADDEAVAARPSPTKTKTAESKKASFSSTSGAGPTSPFTPNLRRRRSKRSMDRSKHKSNKGKSKSLPPKKRAPKDANTSEEVVRRGDQEDDDVEDEEDEHEDGKTGGGGGGGGGGGIFTTGTPTSAPRRRPRSDTLPATSTLLRYLVSPLWGGGSSLSQGGGASVGGTTNTVVASSISKSSSNQIRASNDLGVPSAADGGGGVDDADAVIASDEEEEEHDVDYVDDDDDDIVMDVGDSDSDSWYDNRDNMMANAADYAIEHGGEHYGSYAFDSEMLDWSELPPIPHRFCITTNNSMGYGGGPPYLDPFMLPEQGSTFLPGESKRFPVEQGLFLQAVLQLLAERDQVGVEGSIHSGDNIWKKGPLKKLAFGGGMLKRPGSVTKWNVRYVELRQGNLCYYDDTGEGRKTIHLRQADTVVQESPTNKSHPGFVFELNVQGAPTWYWMASSEEERQSWIRAIQKAIIGVEGPRKELDLVPHQEALEVYTTMRGKIEQADTKELYLEAIQSSMQTLDDNMLQVPAEWIRDQSTDARLLLTKSSSKRNITPHRQLKTSIAEFWKKMGQTTFSINGVTVPRDTPLASARVIGALTRSILEYDKAFAAGNQEAESTTAGKMTELQAVSYARKIFLAILRIKEEQLASTAVRHLLQNPDLVIISDKEDEEYIVHMEVSFAGAELPDEFLPSISDEMAGWLWIRRPKQPAKTSKKRYAVLSGAALTYYEAATPRPVGLRGQFILSGAVLTQRKEEVEGEERFVLTISMSSDQGRILSFDHESDFLEWKEAIQAAIDSAAEVDAAKFTAVDITTVNNATATTTATTPEGRSSRNSIRRSAERVAQGVTKQVIKSADGSIRVAQGVTQQVIKGADGSIRGGIRVIKGAKDGGIKVIRTATDGSMKVLRGAVGRLRPSSQRSSGSDFDPHQVNHGGSLMSRRPSMQVLLNNTTLSGKRDEPTVQCVFQATNNFWVVARNDSDSNGEDRWLSVSAKLYQAFLLLGGPSGRMARGDALIEFDFGETEGRRRGIHLLHVAKPTVSE